MIFVAEGCIFEVGVVRALNGAEAIGMIQTLGFPTIDLVKTGQNISRMRLERGMTVRDLQKYFGFEEPRAIYKWQRGESIPSVDNLFALSQLFGVSMNEILVASNDDSTSIGQQASACCSVFLGWGMAECGDVLWRLSNPYKGGVK